MTIAVTLTASLIFLLSLASCVVPPEPESPPPTDTVTHISLPTGTPTNAVTASPVPQTPTAQTPASKNVSLHGTARASAREEWAQNVIDGDPETGWNSQNFPSQWIAVDLNDLYLVERIELVVAQTPPGHTTHFLWIDNGSGVRTLFQKLSDIHTEDGQTITIEIYPPRPIKEILIQTLDSPSWVAWRAVRAYGWPLALQDQSSTRPPLRREQVLDELMLPVQVTHAGDGSYRLFVVEQQGRIHVVKNGSPNDAPFLDISNRVSCCSERGLLNIAFPPTFNANQRFYLSYTNTNGDTVISRFTTTEDPDIADPASEEILLTVSQPHEAHNGGRLVFGPNDGYLYIGMGDGGSDSRPVPFPQNPALLLGKILRIDVESELVPYNIPADNPFVGDDAFRDEIWALGLRNPWGFNFDSQTGDLYIPDTGHNEREELNFQPASSAGGENYGWPTTEGTRCPQFEDLPYPCSQAGIFDPPVAEYEHTRGCAIVGGVVYRGSQLPHLKGRFLFADFCRGDIWSLSKTESTANPGSNQTNHYAWKSEMVLKASLPISSIGEDEEGNLYVTGYQTGAVYLITER